MHKVNEIFTAHGHKAYLVGGAVRDMLRGKQAHDWDIATDATPQQVMQMFRRVIPTGIAHGTVTIHIYGHEIETTTFRTEAGYSDGRHPDAVQYAATIEEDLSRRDFTMNAIAADLADGTIVDPFHGQEDIRNGIIRTVGSPLERFDEDGLRPVRAIRFAGQLGFKIEENTFAALSHPAVLARTGSISPERFRDELCKMLQTDTPSASLRLMEQTNLTWQTICLRPATARQRTNLKYGWLHSTTTSANRKPEPWNIFRRVMSFTSTGTKKSLPRRQKIP